MRRGAIIGAIAAAGPGGIARGSTFARLEASGRLTVFAAASLTEVFPAIDPRPRYGFAGSDQLAFQIQQGAPADVFAAASPKYPEALYKQGLVEKPIPFATNTLVLIVPKSNPAHIHFGRRPHEAGREDRDRRPVGPGRLLHAHRAEQPRDLGGGAEERRQPGDRT